MKSVARTAHQSPYVNSTPAALNA